MLDSHSLHHRSTKVRHKLISERQRMPRDMQLPILLLIVRQALVDDRLLWYVTETDYCALKWNAANDVLDDKNLEATWLKRFCR
jgi:hypothetical protein